MFQIFYLYMLAKMDAFGRKFTCRLAFFNLAAKLILLMLMIFVSTFSDPYYRYK